MSAVDDAVAAIGAVADQSRARDRDRAGRVRNALAMTDADAEAAVAEMLSNGLNRQTSHDDGPTLARVRQRLAVRMAESGEEPPAALDGLEVRTTAASFTMGRPRARTEPPRPAEVRRDTNPARADLERHYGAHTLVERHEAGHVVAAWALGLDVAKVDVAGSGHFGFTELSRGTTDDEKALIVMLAGMRAERSHIAWDDDLEEIWARTDDHARIEERIDTLGLAPADAAGLRAHLVERVDELLRRHERQLNRVHSALVHQRIISGARLAELLGQT